MIGLEVLFGYFFTKLRFFNELANSVKREYIS